MSLFITGVEDDLPEHAVRTFFSPFGPLRSIVCSHMSHCAFINYATRAAAEAAAESCKGKAVIQGCPLRVQWGRPKPIGTMNKEERIATAKEGRAAVGMSARGHPTLEGGGGQMQITAAPVDDLANLTKVAPPPGTDDVQYASLSGN
jgi:pre-mRNA-splicing factor RBM22/SLT11